VEIIQPTMPRCYIGIGVGAGALQRRKDVRRESEQRCDRSLPKPPLLLVTREVVRHGGKKTSRRDEERREMAAKKEKQRELSSGTAWPSILLVHAKSGRKRIQLFFGYRDHNS